VEDLGLVRVVHTLQDLDRVRKRPVVSGAEEMVGSTGEVLEDLATAGDIDHKASELDDIRKRLKARDVPRKGFCWHCRKPLHARSDSCPFCGEKQ